MSHGYHLATPIGCCSYPRPHRHYPDWLDETVVTDRCKCGQHPRTMTVNDLLRAWWERHP